MVFKLVRTDAEEPNKILLPLGTHMIGRGKFLDCDDKRISRNHGHLIVTEDSVAIEALHQNPCFYAKKGSADTQVLKKACKATLFNGDRFGLLPGSYWFEVLYCILDTDADSQATDVSNTQELETEAANVNQEDKTLSGNVNPSPEDNEELLNFDLNETVENSRSESPSLLDQQNDPQTEQQNEPQADTTNQPTEPAPSNPVPTDTNRIDLLNETDPNLNTDTANPELDLPNNPEATKSPKRSHSPEADDVVKKIKTEPDDVKQELLKQEPEDGQAGPSSDGGKQAGASSSDDTNKASPQPQPPRERCIYGADCYRTPATTPAQIDRLIDYMASNPTFASEAITYNFAQNSEAHWTRLKTLLAVCGPDKPVAYWKQTWEDLITKAGNEGKLAREFARSRDLPSNLGLSEQTSRILTTLGPDCVMGINVPEYWDMPAPCNLIREVPLAYSQRAQQGFPRQGPVPRNLVSERMEDYDERSLNLQTEGNNKLQNITELAAEMLVLLKKFPKKRRVSKMRGPLLKF